MKRLSFIILLLLAAIMSFSQDLITPPAVAFPVYFDVSPPLRSLVLQAPQTMDNSWKDGAVPNYLDMGVSANNRGIPDPGLQDFQGDLPSDTTIQNFEGQSNGGGYVPPDTHGEAGPNHFFQTVNCSYAVYNKNGARIFGPYSNSSVWSGMPNNANSGDAVVMYDEQADRWFFSQFSLPNGSSTAPFFMMIAVSATPDPTGVWYRYQYEFSSMPDYPKFGVWPDAYYMSTNNFMGGWVGNGAYAFDRNAMLAGNPQATRISFNVSPGSDGFISLLPSDCDGIFPAMGTPNYFTFIKTGSSQKLGIYEFHADFANPSASTFGNKVYLTVNPFSTVGGWGTGIPQLGTDKSLDPLSDRLMYRQQFRQFSGYSSVVLNHTVDGGSGNAGIRWYELRNTGSGWLIHQQSTYAPDGKSRWMASIAQDTSGTIALGYSISSAAMYPGIRYTGRLANDPLNQMTMAEKVIIHGGGCQTGIWSGRCRWGDYSGISVDPASPTTFWYTTEYYGSTSSSNWQTRIASFTFSNVFSSDASATPSFLCIPSNDSVQLNAYGYGGSGSYTYAWTSDPAGFTSSLQNPKVFPQESTRYMVTVSDGSQSRYDTVEVTLVGSATAFAGADTIVCWYTSPVPINGVATNYSKVAWGTTGDGHFTHPNAPATDYLPGMQDKISGEVYLKLMVIPISPCTSNASSYKKLTLDPCTGIDTPLTGDAGLTLNPNPASDWVNLSVSGLHEEVTISITAADGRTVLHPQVVKPEEGSFTERLDISGLTRGIYLVVVSGPKTYLTSRLLVR